MPPTSPSLSVFDLPGTPRRLSILVVEDTPVNQKVAQHLLARFGFRADVAASGHEALAALEQRQYDLVLMDVQMPEMDGLEATRRIRGRWPNRRVQIVAMTANVAPEDIRRCEQAGMNSFLGKPIVVESLAKVLGAVVDGPTPPAPAAAVDTQVVGRLCSQIGVESVRQIADMFMADFELAMPALVDGCRAHDRRALARIAHRLKSSARSLGAQSLGELLDTLEQQAASADWPPLHELVLRVQEQRRVSQDELFAELAHQ
jgi:CheY-like chemotaxis protein